MPKIANLVEYDAATGVFRWLTDGGRGRMRFYAGDAAGGVSGEGYLRICVNGRRYYAHRIGWFLYHGRWPRGEIDHINGIKHDNRISNLRLASRSQNNQNVRRRSDNLSGYKGVYFESGRGKYHAQIRAGGQFLYLGRFTTAADAHAAYCEAAARIHGEFARTA